MEASRASRAARRTIALVVGTAAVTGAVLVAGWHHDVHGPRRVPSVLHDRLVTAERDVVARGFTYRDVVSVGGAAHFGPATCHPAIVVGQHPRPGASARRGSVVELLAGPGSVRCRGAMPRGDGAVLGLLASSGAIWFGRRDVGWRDRRELARRPHRLGANGARRAHGGVRARAPVRRMAPDRVHAPPRRRRYGCARGVRRRRRVGARRPCGPGERRVRRALNRELWRAGPQAGPSVSPTAVAARSARPAAPSPVTELVVCPSASSWVTVPSAQPEASRSTIA